MRYTVPFLSPSSVRKFRSMNNDSVAYFFPKDDGVPRGKFNSIDKCLRAFYPLILLYESIWEELLRGRAEV